jgi:hypothetical protein
LASIDSDKIMEFAAAYIVIKKWIGRYGRRMWERQSYLTE